MKWYEKLFLHPERFVKSLLIFLASVFILVYAYFQIAPRMSTTVKTETALAATVEETKDAEGFIFRNESPIALNGKSNVMKTVGEGEKVSKGQKIANAYEASFDTELQQQIEDIDRQIKILSNSSVDKEYIVSDISKIDMKITEIMKELNTDKSRNDYSAAIRLRDDLLIQMNKRQLTSEATDNYTNKIGELQAQKNELNAKLSGVATYIYAPTAGYYSGVADGFEDSFKVSSLDKMTISDYNTMIGSSENAEIKNNSAGKIVTDFRWYVTCSLDRKAAADFEEGKLYSLRFPYSANKEVEMSLKRIVSETDQNQIVLVFTTTTMPEGFNYQRKQDIEIIKNRYTGLKVSKSAMRMVHGVKGVYILVGDLVSFRRAEELYESEDAYLINMSEDAYAFQEDEAADTKKNKYKPLGLYNHVVVEGRNLYDGKIID